MKRFSTRSPLLLLLLSATLLSGCSFFGSPHPEISRFKSSTIENPFFSLPPENLKDYQSRTWILLAESKTKNWFYDPYSISEDEDNIVSYDAFISERGYDDVLHPFNASSIGPYRQKIDCFGNYQWSEIFYAEHMPNQETYKNPVRPGQEWGWIQIKPKTSMAYIRTRICGRKFVDEKDLNYFLYQQGRLPFIKERAPTSKIPAPPKSAEAWVAQFRVRNSVEEAEVKSASDVPKSDLPIFFEVVGNEIRVIDQSRNIRQIRLTSYRMDKDFSKLSDYVFQANCQNRTYSLASAGKPTTMQPLSENKEDLPNVAFNRACGSHGTYMKFAVRK